MKQQLAHTLKTSSVLLRNRTALIGTTNKGCISSLPTYAYETKDKKTAGNMGYTTMRGAVLRMTVLCKVEHLFFALKFGGNNPALRVAQKR
jgi:hypothetical protein